MKKFFFTYALSLSLLFPFLCHSAEKQITPKFSPDTKIEVIFADDSKKVYSYGELSNCTRLKSLIDDFKHQKCHIQESRFNSQIVDHVLRIKSKEIGIYTVQTLLDMIDFTNIYANESLFHQLIKRLIHMPPLILDKNTRKTLIKTFDETLQTTIKKIISVSIIYNGMESIHHPCLQKIKNPCILSASQDSMTIADQNCVPNLVYSLNLKNNKWEYLAPANNSYSPKPTDNLFYGEDQSVTFFDGKEFHQNSFVPKSILYSGSVGINSLVLAGMLFHTKEKKTTLPGNIVCLYNALPKDIQEILQAKVIIPKRLPKQIKKKT